MRKFDTVIYHGGCPDGFTSAWAFWLVHGDTCEYLPYRYGQEPPEIASKTVAIVDFSFPREVLISMAKSAKWVTVLDHHKTAERDLTGLNLDNVEIIFDMERSGAQIAWDYLATSDMLSTERPWVVEYVSDRDLWKNALPHTKEISTALHFDGYFNEFSKLAELCFKDSDDFVERGVVLLEFKNKECVGYAAQAKPAVLRVAERTFNVQLAGCPRQYRSDVGNIMSQTDCDFAAVYWYDWLSREWWISLRAAENSSCDLSEITSHLPNGGGHKKAAGFTIYESRGENLSTYFTQGEQPKVTKRLIEIDEGTTMLVLACPLCKQVLDEIASDACPPEEIMHNYCVHCNKGVCKECYSECPSCKEEFHYKRWRRAGGCKRCWTQKYCKDHKI